MLNVHCWRCGARINRDDFLGLGHFDQNIGKYKGKGFVAFNCPKCNKARYQILDDNFVTLNKRKGSSCPDDTIDLDQVIDFYQSLCQIKTIDTFLERCEIAAKTINPEVKKAILQPVDVYNLFCELNSSNLKRLMVLILDSNSHLITWEFLGETTGRPISFEPKTIFHTPFLMEEKVSVIIAQNLYKHFTQPTQKDILMTKRLIKAGKVLGVEFLDHIVIEENGFHSYDQLNYI